MSPETGRIYESEELEALPKKERDKLIEIPDDQIASVKKMNRKERRAWAAKQRRSKS